jgi:hypothetical protein
MSYEETPTIDKAKKGEKWQMWWLLGKDGLDNPERITRKVEILEDVNAPDDVDDFIVKYKETEKDSVYNQLNEIKANMVNWEKEPDIGGGKRRTKRYKKSKKSKKSRKQKSRRIKR